MTTSADNVERVSAVFAAAGLDPVALPCIRIAPAEASVLAEIREAADRADWLFVTSRRSVATLWGEIGMPDVPVACVGRRTAEAVAQAGGRPALVGTSGASALVERLAPALGGKHVVFPRARAGDPAIAEALASAAGSVVALAAYDTIPIAPDPDPEVDAVVFGSPSAIRGWMRSRSLGVSVIAAMGATTAAALHRRGVTPSVVPQRPGLEPIAQALAEYHHSSTRRTT